MDETENDLKWKELQELWVYLEIEREHLKKKLRRYIRSTEEDRTVIKYE